MAINRRAPQKALSAKGGFVDLYPMPIIENSAPGVNDRAEIGTIWIDQTGNDVYILMEIVGASATWVPIGAGAVVFDSVTSTTFVNAGTTVTAATGLIATTGGVTCSDWTYGTVVSGVAGVLAAQALTNGQVLIGSTAAAPVAATLTAGAGINIANGAGTITITATGATASQFTCDDANVVVPDGVGNIDMVGGVNCGTIGAVANTITINVDNAPTFTGLVTCQLGIDVSGANCVLTSATNAGNDIYLHANGGVAETINIHADQGTGVDSVTIQSDVGGLTLTSGLASDDAINVTATNGGLDVDAALQINITSTENATDAIVINASAGGIDITSGGAAGEDIDITTTSSINMTTSENAAQAIYMHTNGGIAETIEMYVDQGTAADSIYLHSDVGGFTLDTGLNTADSVNIDANSAAGGGFDLDAGTGGIICDTTGAISLDGAATSNFTVAGAGVDLVLESVAGTVIVNAGEDTADAIYLHANGGTTETIRLHSDQGTAATSVHLESDVGGITLTSTGLAADNAITLNSIAGGIDADAALQINVQTTEDANDSMVFTATQGGIDIIAQGADGGDDIDINSARGINIESTADIAGSVYLHANGGATESIDIVASQGTGADSVLLDSTAGGITLTAALATDDAINLEATAGGIDADAALTIDIQTTEDDNAAMVLTATQGGIDIAAQGTDAGDDIDITSAREINLVSTLDGAESIYLHANGGTNESIDLHADQGTGTDSIQLSSDVGGITMTATGLASDDAINLEAVAGGIDIDAGMHIDIQSAEDQNDAIQVIATAGGIDITAQGADAGDDIDINSTQDIHYTSTVDMTYTVGGIYDINGTGNITIDSSAGTIGIGADADAFAINIGTGAAARTITIGNATGATGIAINSGTDDITLTSQDAITLAAAAGDISIDGQSVDINGASGITSMTPATGSVAGVAQTINARVFVATFTGQTTAAAANLDLDLTNSYATQGCGVFVTISNLGSNDADITLEGVITETAGHIICHCQNNGTQALNGDVVMTGWIIN